jgi:hypothetical protein
LRPARDFLRPHSEPPGDIPSVRGLLLPRETTPADGPGDLSASTAHPRRARLDQRIRCKASSLCGLAPRFSRRAGEAACCTNHCPGPKSRLGPPFRLSSVDRCQSIFCGMGVHSSAPSYLPRRHRSRAIEGDRGHAHHHQSVARWSALMLLASCTGYLTNYQTPCVQGHVCECRHYTTVYRSWLDCRDYGRVKSKAY